MNNICYFSEIEGKENQIIRTGKFTDMNGQKVNITKEHLIQMRDNFYKNPLNMKRNGVVQIPINRKHNRDDKAAGWIKELQVKDVKDGDAILIGLTEWVGSAKKEIEDGEWAFISAELAFDYKDNETDKKFGLVLIGAGLTNTPAVSGLNSLLSKENKKEEMTKMSTEKETESKVDFQDVLSFAKDVNKKQKKELLLTLGVKQDEVENKVVQLTQQNTDLSTTNTKLVEDMFSLSSKVEDLEKQSIQAKKEAEFIKLMSEGKACEAQKEAFMADDMVKFAEGAVRINLQEKGSSYTPDAEPKDFEEAQDKIIQLASAKIKEDDKLDMGKAITAVLKENKALNTLYQTN